MFKGMVMIIQVTEKSKKKRRGGKKTVLSLVLLATV